MEIDEPNQVPSAPQRRPKLVAMPAPEHIGQSKVVIWTQIRGGIAETNRTMTERILVVDDEPVNVELLKAFLEDVADDIRGVTNSREVEKLVKEFEPDLVLLDLHMPEMDGLTLLRRLSKVRDNAGYLPVIVLTADNDKAARDTALELEADDFLLKPLDRQEVRIRVRNLLRTRHLFKQLTHTTGTFPRVYRAGDPT